MLILTTHQTPTLFLVKLKSQVSRLINKQPWLTTGEVENFISTKLIPSATDRQKKLIRIYRAPRKISVLHPDGLCFTIEYSFSEAA